MFSNRSRYHTNSSGTTRFCFLSFRNMFSNRIRYHTNFFYRHLILATGGISALRSFLQLSAEEEAVDQLWAAAERSQLIARGLSRCSVVVMRLAPHLQSLTV